MVVVVVVVVRLVLFPELLPKEGASLLPSSEEIGPNSSSALTNTIIAEAPTKAATVKVRGVSIVFRGSQ